MPEYLTAGSSWILVWPLRLFVAASAALIAFPGKGWMERFGIVICFCMLGGTTGFLAGLSRESAIPAVLPSVLTLVGVVAVYLVGREAADENKAKKSNTMVARSVLGLSFTLLVATIWGATERQAYNDGREARKYDYDRQYGIAVREARIKQMRKSLWLDPDSAKAEKKD